MIIQLKTLRVSISNSAVWAVACCALVGALLLIVACEETQNNNDTSSQNGKYTCTNGTVKSGMPDGTADVEYCDACNSGFTKSGDNRCVDASSQNGKYTCTNGTVKSGMPDGTADVEYCDACNSGFIQSGDNRCIDGAARVTELIKTLPDVTELYNQSRAVTDSDTIVVFDWAGGPMAFPHCGTSLGSYPVIRVKQAQQYDSSRLKYTETEVDATHITLTGAASGSEITAAEARDTNLMSYAILKKVRDHFAQPGRTLVLSGISYGAFIIPGYLTTVGADDFDKIIFLVGRTETPDAFVEALATGYEVSYTLAADPAGSSDTCSRSTFEISDTLIKDSPDSPEASVRNQCNIEYTLQNSWRSIWSGQRLFVDANTNYTTEALYALDLSNMFVGTGRNDEASGFMSAAERANLTRAGATVCATNDGHNVASVNSYIDPFIRGEDVSACNQPTNTVSCDGGECPSECESKEQTCMADPNAEGCQECAMKCQ